MPIYAYRCDCGKTADVLVRGREPTSCDDVPELAGACASPGRLARMLTAPNIGRSSGGAIRESGSSGGEATCGACGMAPGSCES